MKNHRRLLRLITILIILGAVFHCPQPAYASLSKQDHDNLMESLQILSGGWIQEHVDRANSILSKAEYTSSDWQEFFSEYFNTNPFTNHLQEYLGYPVFWWFGDDIHLKLQTGLTQPLQVKIQSIVATHRYDLGSSLDADSNLRQTLFNSHRFFNTMLQKNVIGEPARLQIYSFYSNHINAFPELWKSSVTINTSSQPYVAALRGQVYINLGDALPLTSSREMEIAQTIELTGMYATIWADYTVLVIDNNGLDQNQLNVIFNYLGKLPANIHDLRYITVNSLLGNDGEHSEGLASNNGVNIFEIGVGTWIENGFPDDVSPANTDVFSLVLAHEVNHRVDATFTNNNPHLAQRRNNLIAAAGIQHMNYLRSMLEDGFFVNAPQEFFASIANQWFADTEHTLELALVRWEKGYIHPINQFLFFAEIYSQGGDKVPFYTLNEQGQITRKDIPVYRDSNGHIFELVIDGNVYQFMVDEEGNVRGLVKHQIYLPLIQK